MLRVKVSCLGYVGLLSHLEQRANEFKCVHDIGEPPEGKKSFLFGNYLQFHVSTKWTLVMQLDFLRGKSVVQRSNSRFEVYFSLFTRILLFTFYQNSPLDHAVRGKRYWIEIDHGICSTVLFSVPKDPAY